MPVIKLNTKINGSLERVFDLSRSIELHKLSTQQTKEESIAGKTSGLLELDESVTWRAKHFGVWLTHTSKITEFDKPNFFVDEMTKGAFKSFRHEHHFEKTEFGTLMYDVLEFHSPFGILGQLFNRLILTGYLRKFLEDRNATIKAEAENEANEPAPSYSGNYTAADYITWKTDELMELIQGKVFKMSPSPLSGHQILFSDLYAQMIKTIKLKDGCRIWQAPFDVYLIHPGEDWKKTKNIVEPDIFINCDPSKIHRRGCIGAPDFVVEILSPGTRKKDASLKFELYEKYGVGEYWMISISERMILVNLLNEHGKYKAQKPFIEGQTLSPRDFPEMQIDLTELFKDIPEED